MADQAKLVASKNSGKYHLDTCATAQKIDPSNKITFNTPEEAIKAGYSPCKLCNPHIQNIDNDTLSVRFWLPRHIKQKLLLAMW